MHPIFFSHGSIQLSSYALMIGVGACIGVWLTIREVERKGLDESFHLILVALAFGAGMVGARLAGLWSSPPTTVEVPWWRVLTIWDGRGMTLYGGLAASAAMGLVYVKARGESVWEAADTLAPAWIPLLASDPRRVLPERVLLREDHDAPLGHRRGRRPQQRRLRHPVPPDPALRGRRAGGGVGTGLVAADPPELPGPAGDHVPRALPRRSVLGGAPPARPASGTPLRGARDAEPDPDPEHPSGAVRAGSRVRPRPPADGRRPWSEDRSGPQARGSRPRARLGRGRRVRGLRE